MPKGIDYPPEHHLGRDLGIAYRLPAPGRIRLTAACTEHVLRSDGTVSSEAVCSIVDEAVGFVAVLEVLPDWGSTAALSFGFTNQPVEPEGELTVDGSVVKAGRRLVFTECLVTWGNALVAHAEGQFARVGRAGANADMEIPEPDPNEVFEMGTGRGLTAPLGEALGFNRGEAGNVQMRFGDYVSNSSGILHGGVASALVLAAAELAAEAPAVQAGIQFLSPGREGPFVATAAPFEGERTGVWRSETTDSHGGNVMNRAVVRTI